MTHFWAFVAWLLSLLAPASNDEAARCAGAVAAAYASMVRQGPTPPEPGPEPKPGCCDECQGTGWITHGDGHKTPCPCPETCECKKKSLPEVEESEE